MPEHPDCPFCIKPDVVIENELAFVRYDGYPVNPGHCLIIPRRHVAEYFQATADEKTAIWALVAEMKTIIDQEHNPDGYNVGVNIGETAGQSVPHIHVHMIPRYKGDMENPKGAGRDARKTEIREKELLSSRLYKYNYMDAYSFFAKVH